MQPGSSSPDRSARRLEGRVALVTGAARGIGRATAVRLAADRAQIVACDIGDDHGVDTTSYGMSRSGDLAETARRDRRKRPCVLNVVNPGPVDTILSTNEGVAVYARSGEGRGGACVRLGPQADPAGRDRGCDRVPRDR